MNPIFLPADQSLDDVIEYYYNTKMTPKMMIDEFRKYMKELRKYNQKGGVRWANTVHGPLPVDFSRRKRKRQQAVHNAEQGANESLSEGVVGSTLALVPNALIGAHFGAERAGIPGALVGAVGGGIVGAIRRAINRSIIDGNNSIFSSRSVLINGFLLLVNIWIANGAASYFFGNPTMEGGGKNNYSSNEKLITDELKNTLGEKKFKELENDLLKFYSEKSNIFPRIIELEDHFMVNVILQEYLQEASLNRNNKTQKNNKNRKNNSVA